MAIKILGIINLIIAAQAFFLSIHFLFKSKGVPVLSKLLAFLYFSFAAISLNTYLNIASNPQQIELLQDIANNTMWFIGPALYLYVIFIDKKLGYRLIYFNTLPYLVPACIDIFFEWNWFTVIIPFVAFIQMCVYLFLSIKYCIDNYAKARQFYNWILPSIIVFAAIVGVNFTLSILNVLGIQLVPNLVLQSFTTLLVIPVFYLAYKEMNSTNDFGITPKKYQTSKIAERKAKEYLAKIEAAMEFDKLFLQKDLTLQTFAKHVNISPKFVSQIINERLKMNFSDFVFNFRYYDVRQRLIDPENKNLTIFGIAQQSGFKSNSRFNYLFKKQAGCTPKEFQKLHSK